MKSNILLALALSVSTSSYASITGKAQVEILQDIGYGAIVIEDNTATAIYQRLRDQPREISRGLFQKRGENIACTSKKRDTGEGARCGIILDLENGRATPEEMAFPAPGTTIRN